MSTVEVNKIESDIFPLEGKKEPESVLFEAIRERLWVLEHPCAGNIDTTIEYGKWVGDETHFEFVDYDIHNWAGWNPDIPYHPGFPIVKYRWGPGVDQVDIFVFKGTAEGDILSANPPVVGGQLNGLWLLTVDPNKYSHWNFNAGRPDIGADHRYIISHHGWDDPADGGEGWLYGTWKAYEELPTDTDPYEQIPYVKTASLKARHKPVEKERYHITTKLQTQTRRMFQDGYVGIKPYHTWWWDHIFPDTISEYIRLNGDPWESIQQGPDYREPKKNLSFQDRVQHAVEQNYNYAVEVDDDWKKAFQYWYVYGQEMDVDHKKGCVGAVWNRVYGGYSDAAEWKYGGGPWPTKGDVVWHNNYFWLCIHSGGEWYEPGTEGGKEHWATKDDLTPKPLYQPNYLNTHPVYVQFSDPLFHCNSSAFEKVLKNIGKYDWYWDDRCPALDWWMYQLHYYFMTLHRADPDEGHEQKALRRWPLPRGCWRRVWRHTQNWNKYRNQKARFGKEINIDGKMVSMMWPGEMGTPPGYGQQFVPSKALLDYRNTKPAFHFDDLTYQHVISEAQYNQMQEDPTYWWLYKQYYTVIDVEELFRQAYKNSIWPERRIAERHDPQATDWILVYNKQTDRMEPEEVPIFELHHDLVNDMRDALLELKFLGSQRTKEIKQLYHYTNKWGYSSGLLAYQAGKNLELYAEYGGSQFQVGYRGLVGFLDNQWQHFPHDPSLPENHCQISLARITIVTENQDFPHKLVGTAMIRILYRSSYSGVGFKEGCKIGFGGIELDDERTPTWPLIPWKAAYIGLETKDFKWEWNAVDEKWEYKCESETVLLEDWPPEAYFDKTYIHGEYRDWIRALEINFDIDNDCIFQIDFDGYDGSVFERDLTNFIEV